MKFLSLVARATTVMDRWVMGLSAVGIVGLIWSLVAVPGQQAEVFRENRLILTLPLHRDVTTQVEGRLGLVTIQVQKGGVRLLEYNSPRMIGTRTGWIYGQGRTTACVPCGILVQVKGGSYGKHDSEWDAVAQ